MLDFDAALQEGAPSTPESMAPRPKLVLVVAADDSSRSVLEVALAKDGFDVWSANSAAAGSELASAQAPDAVVVDAPSDPQEALTFVARLRGDDRLATVPVMVLAEAAPSLDAMADAVGVDAVVGKPAFARDVATLLRLELAKNERSLELVRSDLPPEQLLRALLASPRSGRLLLAEGRAEVRFRVGKVVDARFDEHGGSLEVLVRALALTRERYQLVLEPINGFAELSCGLREVIEWVIPRLARWERSLAKSVPLDSRLVVDFSRLASSLSELPDEINRVVQLFDGRRSVYQVLVESSFPEVLTLEVVTRLYLMSVLTPVDADDDELVVLRPMPKLFDPQPTETRDVMNALFGDAPVAQVSTATQADVDWTNASFEPTDADPAGGWSVSPVPVELAAGLDPSLAKQLEAFHTPMAVEPKERPVDEQKARGFVAGEAPVDASLEQALHARADAEPSVDELEARLNAALEPERPTSASDELEAQFFAQSRSESESVSDEPSEALPAGRSTRVWPYVIGALVIGLLALLADMTLSAPSGDRAAAEAEAVAPAMAVAPQVPVVSPPAPAEVVVEAPPAVEPAIDVSENLLEAKRLYEAGQYARAQSILEQLLTDDPASVTGWNLMALVRYDRGDVAGARQAAERVLSLDGNDARVQLLLATMHFDANEKEAGRAALERYLSLEPQGPHAADARALLAR